MTFPRLLADWDAQQSAYIAHRELRFAAMLDLLELRFGDAPFTVVDLGCGPGSLSNRILDRFDAASAIGVDHDPTLLELARRTSPHHGVRLRLVDADLLDPAWTSEVAERAGGPVHAAVSTTALHWTAPHELVALYAQTRDLLADGGLLVNGDHFRFDSRTPVIADWAARHDARTQRDAFAAGAPTWDSWWQRLREAPGMAAAAAERDRRFAERLASPPTAVDFQLAALAQAGFAESGTAWQFLDDYVVYGVR
ncbi:MAG: class I SAM-dependent methyltransferase [Gordonia sp. (in: high G+C Gram-positive bacteria)]|uniref:class I SAM-dependent methyltransferase n=1 Tax=Gordonia sp. (in: high G+C Gram-positive bacteria) TaxID=84139 RepID=UPI0039E6D984